jgi:DUF2959 family protein
MRRLLLGALIGLGACRGAYYSTMEKFGVHKRDILVDRVEDGREAQSEAKEQFAATLERFQELTGVEPDDLDEAYEDLADEQQSCESRAKEVRERIAAIEEVSADLFAEWESEIESMSSKDLQRQSRETMTSSRERYAELISAMKKAEAQMDPVLTAFRDHVLFLKHNLNARAISSLETTVSQIEGDVARLIAEMQASIEKADEFIASMQS